MKVEFSKILLPRKSSPTPRHLAHTQLVHPTEAPKMPSRFAAIAACALLCLVHPAVAQDDHHTDDVARWDFDTEETTPIRVRGSVQRDQAGPRPPEFPELSPANTAIKLDASGFLSISDTGPESKFDFTNGDAITLEAWVNPSNIQNGQPQYIIGKGRTTSPKFARDNQNWALRIMGQAGQARVNFLFASKLASSDRHWHRWTSKDGFPVSTGWHHIAVTYKFGEPDSIRGWVNGKPTDGTWDMGGPTKKPPVVDDDEVRIGERFAGMLDAVAIHRRVLDDKTLADRFKRVGKERVVRLAPEVMPDLGDIPPGKVLYQISESMPAGNRWLYESESWPNETTRWYGDAFLLPRIPVRYDDWGIRTSWQAPLLLRIAGDVELPAGQHRFLTRVRSLSRLWIDGKLVHRTKTVRNRGGNLEPIVPIPKPLVENARLLPFPQQEAFTEFEIPAANQAGPRKVRVVLELLVGALAASAPRRQVDLQLDPSQCAGARDAALVTRVHHDRGVPCATAVRASAGETAGATFC